MAVASAKSGRYGRKGWTLPNKYSIIDSFKVENAKTTASGEKLS